MIRRLLSSLVLLFAGTVAQADDSNWRFFATVGESTGGDTIIAGTITTIGTNQVLPFEIRPGTGTQYRLGADYRLLGRVTLQCSIGRSVTDPMGMDGSLEFSTTPIEFLAFLNLIGGARIGGGARKSYAEMTGSGKAAGWSGLGTYTSTQGAVVELQYLFSADDSATGHKRSQAGIAMRFVQESFTHGSSTFNGDHREIALVFYY